MNVIFPTYKRLTWWSSVHPSPLNMVGGPMWTSGQGTRTILNPLFRLACPRTPTPWRPHPYWRARSGAAPRPHVHSAIASTNKWEVRRALTDAYPVYYFASCTSREGILCLMLIPLHVA
jgi:hypothetical protein